MKVNKLKPPSGKSTRLDIANFLLAKIANDDNEWQRGGANDSDVDDEEEQSSESNSGDDDDAEESESDENSLADESESGEAPVSEEDDDNDNKMSLLRTPSSALRAMDSTVRYYGFI
jgi:hypothetical protein